MVALISKNRPIWIITVGFILVITTLTVMVLVGRREVESIRKKAAMLAKEHLFTAKLVDSLEQEQQRAGAILVGTIRVNSDSQSRLRILAELDSFDQRLPSLIQEGRHSLPNTIWLDLEDSAKAYSREVRQALESKNATKPNVDLLEFRYEKLVHLLGQIIKQNSINSAEIDSRIERESIKLAGETGWLLGGCIVVALVCAVLTIQFTVRSLKHIKWQAEEINRVSWHLIAGQEIAARRFSHEMHDELGQSLTGLKATLLAVTPSDFSRKRSDCLQMVDEAITNVRELSQLLRPVILDDFGLEAALRWLAERFQERTRIQIDFESNFTKRLQDEVETHMFRITQEALTNVARHSNATYVKIKLYSYQDKLLLAIADNGVGLTQNKPTGLGLVGMRARAQQIDAEFSLQNQPLGGVKIEISAPLRLLEKEV